MSSNLSKQQQWSEETFFARLAAKYSTPEQQVARDLYNWAEARGLPIKWGKGISKGTFTPVLRHNSKEFPLFAVWTSGGIEFLFKYLASRPPFTDPVKQQELLQVFNAVSALDLPPDSFSRFPGVSLLALTSKADLDQLTAALDWLVEQIRAA